MKLLPYYVRCITVIISEQGGASMILHGPTRARCSTFRTRTSSDYSSARQGRFKTCGPPRRGIRAKPSESDASSGTNKPAS